MHMLNNNNQSKKSLQLELIEVLREYFSLRMQFKLGQLKQVQLLKKSRCRVANIKLKLFQEQKIIKCMHR